jgi:large subunit ribosomal protein L25
MAGNVPGVVYGPETEPISISVEEKAFRVAMRQAGRSTIIALTVDGQEHKTIVREIQRDPVTLDIKHVDFHAISMTQPIDVSLPIQFEGVPVGVRVDGGIQQITMRELEISCLPKDIPDELVIDVTELGIGDAIHVSDITLENVRILSPERRTIVVIAAPTVVKEAVTAAEEEEGEEVEGEAAEGEAPAEGAAEGEGDKEKDKKE